MTDISKIIDEYKDIIGILLNENPGLSQKEVYSTLLELNPDLKHDMIFNDTFDFIYGIVFLEREKKKKKSS